MSDSTDSGLPEHAKGMVRGQRCRLAYEVVAQAQNLRGYIEDLKSRDADEARAIIDFIDAVDTYNLSGDDE